MSYDGTSVKESIEEFKILAVHLVGTERPNLLLAEEFGLMYYWPDKFCKRNHRSYRYTVGGNCVECRSPKPKFKKLAKTPPELTKKRRNEIESALELNRLLDDL